MNANEYYAQKEWAFAVVKTGNDPMGPRMRLGSYRRILDKIARLTDLPNTPSVSFEGKATAWMGRAV